MNPERGVLKSLRGGLVVSCQARPEEPLGKPEHLAALAKSAELGGACAIRAEAPENIAAIKAAVSVPVIGIWKRTYPGSSIYITPTFGDAEAVIKAGADTLALDATLRPRPRGESLEAIVKLLRKRGSMPLMADVSNLEEGLHAEALGFDIVGTTLSGYTENTRNDGSEPDFELVKALRKALPSSCLVAAEGRIATPEHLRKACESGADFAVVGTAITRPIHITRGFVEALPER